MKKSALFILLIVSVFFSLHLKAQNKISDTPFKDGEVARYDMYFKFGLVSSKAGKSTFIFSKERYKGQPGWKLSMYAKTSGLVKSFYSLNDTLYSYFSEDLRPLLFEKDAVEGKDHTLEDAVYEYVADEIRIHTTRIRNEKLRFDTVLISKQPVYDMLSILYYVRTLDYSALSRGDIITVTYISGKRMGNMDIKYRGTETIKANDGEKYKCLKLVMILNEEAFEDGNEAMRVYIYDDPSRLPIRIDTKLKKGSMRAILDSKKL